MGRLSTGAAWGGLSSASANHTKARLRLCFNKGKTMTEKRLSRWKPGETGNPKGRPPGQSEITRLRAALADEIPSILNALVASAQRGDVQAARLLLERVLPAVKAIELPQAIELPVNGSLTDQGHAVLRAIAEGKVGPAIGSALLGAIGTLARVTEIDQLVARLDELEQKLAKG